MTELDERFLREAIRIAVDNVHDGGGPFGAIIVRGDEEIARGVNTVTASRDPTAHAEINAIREACRVLGTFCLEGCTLYTSCEPCPMCLGAVYWARVERVVFAAERGDAADVGFDDSAIYEEITLPFDMRRVEMSHCLHDEGGEPFREWEQNDDRIAY